MTRGVKARPKGKGPPPALPAPVPPRGVRRGGLSRADRAAIERMAGSETPENIALKLRRSTDQVLRHVEELGLAPVTLKVGSNLSSELEGRPEWAEFRRHYDDEELAHIRYRYVQLMNQFGRDDVLPTEELQIFALIQAEIMANQSMRERKTLVTQQKLVQRQLEAVYGQIEEAGGAGPRDLRREAADLEGRFAEIGDQLKQINTRHASHIMQQNGLLERLRGTREQRANVLDNSKASFLGFLKALAQEDFRREAGDEAEKMKIAMGRERERMSRPAEYLDGTTDRPLLTPEVLAAADEEASDE